MTILLKTFRSCFDGLSMNGNSSTLLSETPVRPFDKLRAGSELLSKGNGVFQQNQMTLREQLLYKRVCRVAAAPNSNQK